MHGSVLVKEVVLDFAFIDHYDSFSRNVVAWLKSANASSRIGVVPYDDTQKMAGLLQSPKPLVLSPGPHSPMEAFSSVNLVRQLWGRVPILGICLGHQIIAVSRGASMKQHIDPHHGMAREVIVTEPNCYIFKGIPQAFLAASYNSLTVNPLSLTTTDLKVVAVDTYNAIQSIVCVRDDLPPVLGLQFHPDSFLTEHAALLARNWMQRIAEF